MVRPSSIRLFFRSSVTYFPMIPPKYPVVAVFAVLTSTFPALPVFLIVSDAAVSPLLLMSTPKTPPQLSALTEAVIL